MILTCSACLTRYLIDARALGATGRVVRCASCSHTWHQSPPEDAPLRVDVLLPPEPASHPQRTNLPALVPQRRRSSGLVPWVVLAVLFAAIGIAGHLGRERVVEAWPPAAKLYAMLGIAVEPLGAGLEIRGVTSERRIGADGPELAIAGEIVNTTGSERPVPRLKGVLKDAGERALTSWTFTASGDRLLPGEATSFTTVARDPDRRAAGLSITFTASP
ncbi:MAG: DUF3426 domain-containing protein [Alphaproteobacteria bacterium]